MKDKIKLILFIAIFLMVLFLSVKTDPLLGAVDNEKKIEEVARKVFPSVVKVEAKNRTKKVATGVVFDKDGYVVTTALISPRDEKISIITSDGKKVEAEFLGMDSETHIALLRAKNKKLVPITTGKSQDVLPGTWIGVVSVSPENTPAITQGIISSTSEEKIRLNVWVIPGSSGSPVVTRDGRMIGLLRGIYSEDKPVVFEFRDRELVGSGYVFSKAEAPSSGMALAVPVEVVKKVVLEIKEKGKVERGWLGVSITDTEDGKVKIVDVEKESPAAIAELEDGDIILRIDGKEVKNVKKLASEIRKRKPGKSVTLEIERNGKEKKVKVRLGEYPEREIKREFEVKFPRLFPPTPPKPSKIPEPPRIKLWPKEKFEWSWESRKYIGVYLEEISRELSQYFGVEKGRGLLVSRFTKDSPAEKAGLRVGDVIVRAGGKRVETVEELSGLLQDKEEGEKIKIEFLRDKKMKSVEVEVAEEEKKLSFFSRNSDLEEYFKSLEDYNKRFLENYRKWYEKYSKECKDKVKRIKEEVLEKSRKLAEKVYRHNVGKVYSTQKI